MLCLGRYQVKLGFEALLGLTCYVDVVIWSIRFSKLQVRFNTYVSGPAFVVEIVGK
jgi:hypothetical protein